MTNRYVGPGGSDSNTGLSWAQRYLTLTKAATVVAAGDNVYIGPGTYREQVTLTVSGTSGSPIRWIGDFQGANTDGVGGIVRVTGSPDDINTSRTNCIVASSVNYNDLTGIAFDLPTTSNFCVSLTSCQNWNITKCHFQSGCGISLAGSGQLNTTVDSCCFEAMGDGSSAAGTGVLCTHSSTVNSAGHVIQNCRFTGTVNSGGASGCVAVVRVGDFTVKHNTMQGSTYGVVIFTAPASGHPVIVTGNNMHNFSTTALSATSTADMTEDYNNIYNAVSKRANVNIGANSTSYPPLYDPRWWFVAVGA